MKSEFFIYTSLPVEKIHKIVAQGVLFSLDSILTRDETSPWLCTYQCQAGGEGEAWHTAGICHFPKNCCQIPYPRAKL